MTPSDTAFPDVVDVVVIGFGPVGATLAALLARRGRRVVVIDREIELFPLPRAAHVDGEAMRILQEVGCAEEIRDTLVANPGMDFLTADHQVLMAMRTGSSSPYGWHQSNFMYQPHFEGSLRAAVERLGVDIRLGVAAQSLQQSADDVTVTLSDGTTCRARFAVGCDGARSFTRRALGITMDDLAFEEPWLVVDLILQAGAADRLPDHALQVCDPARPHTVVPMPAPRFRFEFMLLPGEDPEVMQRPETVRGLLEPWLAPDAAALERSAVYTFHGLIATQWRDHRVLLAGDAAHQTPPFLGQGMCSGMRDAANLAWKLDAVMRGAPDELLDTYQTERDPHVRGIVEAAVAFGRIICTTDAAVAADRDAAMLAARSTAPDAANDGGIPMAPLGGPLVTSGGGVPAPQPRLDGILLDEVAGLGWTVITRTAAHATEATRIWAPVDATVMCGEDRPALLALLGDAWECAVMRPDRYLYGVGTVADLGPPEIVVSRSSS